MQTRQSQPWSDGHAQERRSRPPKPIVVLIDDHDDTCECFAVTLEREGYHVLTAVGGAEGIRLVAARRPHVVIVNLYMPGTDGWHVCEFVRSYEPTRNASIVLFTGAIRADGANRSRARSFGACFVAKPCVPHVLASVLNALLAPKRATTQ